MSKLDSFIQLYFSLLCKAALMSLHSLSLNRAVDSIIFKHLSRPKILWYFALFVLTFVTWGYLERIRNLHVFISVLFSCSVPSSEPGRLIFTAPIPFSPLLCLFYTKKHRPRLLEIQVDGIRCTGCFSSIESNL